MTEVEEFKAEVVLITGAVATCTPTGWSCDEEPETARFLNIAYPAGVSAAVPNTVTVAAKAALDDPIVQEIATLPSEKWVEKQSEGNPRRLF